MDPAEPPAPIDPAVEAAASAGGQLKQEDVRLARWILQYGYVDPPVIASALTETSRYPPDQPSVLARILIRDQILERDRLAAVVDRARRAIVGCGVCGARFAAPGATIGNIPPCLSCGGVLRIESEVGEEAIGGVSRADIVGDSAEASAEGPTGWPVGLPSVADEPAPGLEGSAELELGADALTSMELPAVGLSSARDEEQRTDWQAWRTVVDEQAPEPDWSVLEDEDARTDLAREWSSWRTMEVKGGAPASNEETALETDDPLLSRATVVENDDDDDEGLDEEDGFDPTALGGAEPEEEEFTPNSEWQSWRTVADDGQDVPVGEPERDEGKGGFEPPPGDPAAVAAAGSWQKRTFEELDYVEAPLAPGEAPEVYGVAEEGDLDEWDGDESEEGEWEEGEWEEGEWEEGEWEEGEGEPESEEEDDGQDPDWDPEATYEEEGAAVAPPPRPPWQVEQSFEEHAWEESGEAPNDARGVSIELEGLASAEVDAAIAEGRTAGPLGLAEDDSTSDPTTAMPPVLDEETSRLPTLADGDAEEGDGTGALPRLGPGVTKRAATRPAKTSKLPPVGRKRASAAEARNAAAAWLVKPDAGDAAAPKKPAKKKAAKKRAVAKKRPAAKKKPIGMDATSAPATTSPFGAASGAIPPAAAAAGAVKPASKAVEVSDDAPAPAPAAKVGTTAKPATRKPRLTAEAMKAIALAKSANAKRRASESRRTREVSFEVGGAVDGVAKAAEPIGKDERLPDNLRNYQAITDLRSDLPGGLFKVRELGSNRLVSLRLLPAREELGDELCAVIVERARSSALFRDPHIARVIDFGEHEGRLYLASELHEGMPLADFVEKRRPAPEDGVRLVRHLAASLERGRVAGLEHGSVCAERVVVRIGDQIRPMLDGFDIGGLGARIKAAAGGASAALAEANQAFTGGGIDDVRGLGALLHHLVVGKPVADDGAVGKSPRVDRDLDSILRAALTSTEEDRYPSPGALSIDLAAWLAGQKIRARRGRYRPERPWLVRGIVVAVVVLLLGALLAPIISRRLAAAKVAGLVAEAEELLARGQAKGAIDLMLEAIETDPDAADARAVRARAFIETRQFLSAIDDLDRALLIDPLRGELHRLRAIACRWQGYLDRAISSLHDALGLDPNDREALALRAVLYERNGQSKEALADLGSLIHDAPSGRLLLRRGLLLARIEGRERDALYDLDRALDGDAAASAAVAEAVEGEDLAAVGLAHGHLARARLRRSTRAGSEAAIATDLARAVELAVEAGDREVEVGARRVRARVELELLGLLADPDQPEDAGAGGGDGVDGPDAERRRAVALERARRLHAVSEDLARAIERFRLQANDDGGPRARSLDRAEEDALASDRVLRAAAEVELAAIAVIGRELAAASKGLDPGDDAVDVGSVVTEHLGRALAEAEATLETRPNDGLASVLRGQALSGLDGGAVALLALDHGLAAFNKDAGTERDVRRGRAPLAARAHLARARIFLATDGLAVALRHAGVATSLAPRFVAAWLLTAEVLRRQDRIEDAFATIDRASALVDRPPSVDQAVGHGPVDVAIARAAILERKGTLAERRAGSTLAEAGGDAVGPDHVEARRCFEDAIAELARALELGPTEGWRLRAARAELHIRIGQLIEAATSLQGGIETTDDPAVKGRLLARAARVRRLTGDVEKAEKMLRESIALAGDAVEARTELADILLARLEELPLEGFGADQRPPLIVEIRAHLQAALEASPGDVAVWRLRVLFASRHGEPTEVIELANEAIDERKLIDPVIVGRRGRAFVATHKIAKAQADQRLVAQLDATEGYRVQAVIFAKLGDWGTVMHWLRDADAKTDDDVETLALRARAGLKVRGGFDAATVDLKRWSELRSNRVEPLRLLGDAYDERGDAAGLDWCADRLDTIDGRLAAIYRDKAKKIRSGR